MPCDIWRDIEKQYRIAVHAYSDAVNHLDGAKDFDSAWRQIEAARADADRGRAALMAHQRKHLCVPMRGSSGHAELLDPRLEETTHDDLILGDQGQSGG